MDPWRPEGKGSGERKGMVRRITERRREARAESALVFNAE
jgi:hypothetical protein